MLGVQRQGPLASSAAETGRRLTTLPMLIQRGGGPAQPLKVGDQFEDRLPGMALGRIPLLDIEAFEMRKPTESNNVIGVEAEDPGDLISPKTSWKRCARPGIPKQGRDPLVDNPTGAANRSGVHAGAGIPDRLFDGRPIGSQLVLRCLPPNVGGG